MLTSSSIRMVRCNTHHLLIKTPACLLHSSGSSSIYLFTISNSLDLTSNTAQLHTISKPTLSAEDAFPPAAAAEVTSSSPPAAEATQSSPAELACLAATGTTAIYTARSGTCRQCHSS